MCPRARPPSLRISTVEVRSLDIWQPWIFFFDLCRSFEMGCAWRILYLFILFYFGKYERLSLLSPPNSLFSSTSATSIPLRPSCTQTRYRWLSSPSSSLVFTFSFFLYPSSHIPFSICPFSICTSAPGIALAPSSQSLAILS